MARTIKMGRYIIKISNEDKALFPKVQVTKGDLIDYYRKIASTMLGYIKNRPISMHRFPDGINEEGFYQKDAPDYFPSWITTKNVKKKEGGSVNYVLCNNAATLVYLANQGCITIHPWLSRADKLNYPNRMIFDLDPAKKDFAFLCATAKKLRDILKNHGLKSYVMTTGSKGLHVVVPLIRNHTFDTVRDFAQKIARELVNENPKKLTLEVRKAKRKGRVFIDTLRNAFGQTGVAPYSVRALASAPVATPLQWKELDDKNLGPQSYTIENIFKRLGQIKDPWKGIDRHARTLPKI